jgi:protein-tyrosine phosphatase
MTTDRFVAVDGGFLTDVGRAALKHHGVSIAIDLRRPEERTMHPNLLDGLPVQTLAEGDASDGFVLPPHLAYLRDNEIDAAAMHRFMIETYMRVPYEEAHLRLYARTFDVLAEGGGPVVVHCAAGKDRTGILVALIHDVLGVNEADIEHDYLLTNAIPTDESAERLKAYVDRIFEAFGKAVTPDDMKPMMGVDLSFLHTAWAAMAERDGGRADYLARLGVDDAKRAAIRERLLV